MSRPASGGRGGPAQPSGGPRPSEDERPRGPRRGVPDKGAAPATGVDRRPAPRPVVPDDITGFELDKSVRGELSGLPAGLAKEVGRHLVYAGRLLDDDPEAAYAHATAARERASRVAAVREAVGLTAYATGRYAEALAELRTVRRLTGSNEHLPVMADCERGLDRPERAIALARSDEAEALDTAGRVEMLIVAAGARADLGELDAAVLTLQVPQLRSTAKEPWLPRLWSAYADALEAVGRGDEAREWLERAADTDVEGTTGAAERLAELDGVLLVDLEEDDLEGNALEVEADEAHEAHEGDGEDGGGESRG